MATAVGGRIVSGICTISRFNVGSYLLPSASLQVRYYAARKGTREKARKKKVKVEVKKWTLGDHIARSKKVVIKKPDALVHNDDYKADAVDDVYFTDAYKSKVYSFAEAIRAHWEITHPTVYNVPNAVIMAHFELNMQGIKKTKFIESFTRLAPMPHRFDFSEDRTVIVFCKTEELQKEAENAGATEVGGPELIKKIQTGEINLAHFQTIIAHPNILPEILVIKGLMKKNFPNLKTNTLGPDLERLVHMHLYGLEITGHAYPKHVQYGYLNMPIGKISMDLKQLEENFEVAVQTVETGKPQRAGNIIRYVRLSCPPSKENLKVDHTVYQKTLKDKRAKKSAVKEEEEEEEDDDVDEEDVAVPVGI